MAPLLISNNILGSSRLFDGASIIGHGALSDRLVCSSFYRKLNRFAKEKRIRPLMASLSADGATPVASDSSAGVAAAGHLGESASGAKSASLASGENGVHIVLVGDSTVTGKSEGRDQAGWGWALFDWVKEGVCLENTAVGGRSSRSFRTEGRWDDAMMRCPDWVFIQFGHNDQPGKGPERESDAETDFREHLRQYVREAREQGTIPVLVTPVCRRIYDSAGALRNSLRPYADAVLIVAEEMGVPCLDLHQHSFEKFSQMTPDESLVFSPSDQIDDRTHFSVSGSVIVSHWVLTLMDKHVPELAHFFERPADESTRL